MSATKKALDSRPTTKAGDKLNAFPSTSHYDKAGVWIPDELNNPLATQNTSAHDLGQLRHVGGRPGYCEAHLTLGCDLCRAADQG